jgi:hypothetical protein
LVVVRVSKTKAAKEILVDRGVDEACSREERRCERIVVFPEPDSPRKIIDWFSALPAIRAIARDASSSASPIALPSLPPSGPLVDAVYVLRDIRPCDESRAVGRET